MKLCLRLIALCFCFGLPAASWAQDGVLQGTPPPADSEPWNVIPEKAEKLNGDQLRAAFSGITHKGQYRFLRAEIGTFAFTETTRDDGTLIHRQGGETLSGIWNIDGDQICYTYDKIWTYPVCFNIYKSGTCYYHNIRSSNGAPRNAVTARSTPSTQTPDCDVLTS